MQNSYFRKLIAHRQNVVDDKSVDEQTNSQNVDNQQNSIATKNAETKDEKIDEYVYMELPEQPKRQAPIPPNSTATPDRQKSQSLKARRKAPAPPSKSRSFSGKFLVMSKTGLLKHMKYDN